uniref:Putative glutamine cyclotransferase n=1 Tax=uncultured marine group II/III euryarchaeote KM3_33_F08 TaxID=1456435 RepID=A0A075H4N8_9EURY|nr:putative glutamine cyclotransferase [uncultured marine group II/III euryarchaeote KM3_33_F08]
MIRSGSGAFLPIRALLAVATLLLVLATPCPNVTSAQTPNSLPIAYEIVVVETIAHNESAFTQGLVIHEGRMYESTGMYDHSELRELDLETGEVLRTVPLDGSEFGEGLAVVGDELVQLTWKSGVAHRYSIETFEQVGNFTFDGEGWGLCAMGDLLYMSNGSSMLTIRNPTDFSVVDEIEVTLGGEPLEQLNELECLADGTIYANVWYDDSIYLINGSSGQVVGVVDASALTPDEAESNHVLNGIAFDTNSAAIYVTGKYWPVMYEVTFQEVVEPSTDSNLPPGDGDENTPLFPPWEVLILGGIAAALTFLLWGNGFDSLTKSRGVHNPPDVTEGLEGEE